MLKAERLRVKATILECGVAQTFKQYGEWTALCQAEVSAEVLQEAIALRKQSEQIQKNIQRAGEQRRKNSHGKN